MNKFKTTGIIEKEDLRILDLRNNQIAKISKESYDLINNNNNNNI